MSFAGIVSLVIPAGCFALAVGAAWLAARRIFRRRAHLCREWLLLIFVMYLAAVTEIIALRFGAHRVERTLQLRLLHTTLGELKQGAWPFIYHVAGNIFCFIPLGLLLPGMKPRLRFGQAVLAGAALSALLEIMQWLLSSGMTDIDDVLLNALGAAVGFGLHCVFRNIFPVRRVKGLK